MNAKELIQLNNQKREQLNSENLAYYGDMLTYIRMKKNKSELQTEEILLELLEHLLKAQEEGRTAKDVFGEDLKAYCDEVIDELPKEQTTKTIKFITYVVIDLAATVSITIGLISYGLYAFFDLGSDAFTFPIGSALVIILIALLLLYLYIKLILKWLNDSTFKKKTTNKWLEFFQLWLFVMVFMGIIFALFTFMPSFGASIRVPHLVTAGIGVILFVIAKLLNKKYRITK